MGFLERRNGIFVLAGQKFLEQCGAFHELLAVAAARVSLVRSLDTAWTFAVNTVWIGRLQKNAGKPIVCRRLESIVAARWVNGGILFLSSGSFYPIFVPTSSHSRWVEGNETHMASRTCWCDERLPSGSCWISRPYQNRVVVSGPEGGAVLTWGKGSLDQLSFNYQQ
jgi:hypothetical protein